VELLLLLPCLIVIRSPGSPSIWGKAVGGFVHSAVDSWWNPKSYWLLWYIARTNVTETKSNTKVRVSTH